MVSLISLLANALRMIYHRFRPPSEGLIQIRRVPPTKSLRVHLLGLSLGFLLASLNFVFDLSLSNLIASSLILLWLGLATYYAGLYFIATVAAFFLLRMPPPAMGTSEFLLVNSLHWYVLGYLCGAALALLYNDLLFLFVHFVEEKNFPLAFVYDTRRNINIIKSPDQNEERAFQRLLARFPDLEKQRALREQRLYQYHLATPPSHPYTIVFAANPRIRQRGGNAADPAAYDADAILTSQHLFLRAVDQALQSFEMDPVIGRPEIWSRVRVLTVFNPSLTDGPRYGLVEPFMADMTENNNIIAPRAAMHTNFYKNLWADSRQSGDPDFALDEFDVIFGMTASLTQTRSFANFSDWEEVAGTLRNSTTERDGVPFTFNPDPCGNKSNIVFPQLYPHGDIAHDFRQVHDFCSTIPGRVALNILSARAKSYTHEFAHAMSSIFHGTIADEYTDCLIADNATSKTNIPQIEHFWANRIDRDITIMHSDQPIPVPKVYAEYNCTRYNADMNHPTAEENWTGYFPEKFDRVTHCTMDREMGPYRFDELLSAFIYDRLMAKVRRP